MAWRLPFQCYQYKDVYIQVCILKQLISIEMLMTALHQCKAAQLDNTRCFVALHSEKKQIEDAEDSLCQRQVIHVRMHVLAPSPCATAGHLLSVPPYKVAAH